LAFGDMDGDNDLDIVVGNSQQNRHYSNLSRQVAWRGVPRIGKPLVLDLCGPSNGWWRLVASRFRAHIPVPPYGTLWIDPAGILYDQMGNFDTDGRAFTSLDVPSWPTLVGFTLYWQAVVAPPVKFTNLEITTFTDL
jgi:hypothetical protein